MVGKKRYLPILIIVTLCVAVVSVYALGNLKSNLDRTHASYRMYSELDTLLQSCDLVIEGEILEVSEPFSREIKVRTDNDIQLFSNHAIARVQVIDVVKGSIEKGTVIEVLQEGEIFTERENKNSEKHNKFDVEKIYKKNDNYLLFLKSIPSMENISSDEVLYMPLNPYQGQIKIFKNKIRINKEWMPIFEDGISVDKAKEKIRK